jgi:hypothetical protein
MSDDVLKVVAAILVALVGYIVTYANNVRLENRKAQIKFISDQVQYLYGPLFSLNAASREAWESFRSRCRPKGAFFSEGPDAPSDHELEQWRLWMSEVFMPMNLKMEKVIIENVHLIEGATMPKSFLELLAHVEVYKTVIKKWENQDFSEHTSYFNFPENFDADVAKTFTFLKRRQAALIGKR